MQIIRRRLAVIAAAALAIAPDAARAHPHVFIEHAIEVTFDDRDGVAVRLTWTFDEMYSSMIQHDFVKTRSGKLSSAEIRRIEQKAFSNLAEYNYFTEIRINRTPMPIRSVKDFDASFADGKATYRFTIPLNAPAPAAENTLELTVFDPDYFVDYKLKDGDPLTVKAHPSLKADCRVERDIPKDSAYGKVDSDTVRCSFGRKG